MSEAWKVALRKVEKLVFVDKAEIAEVKAALDDAFAAGATVHDVTSAIGTERWNKIVRAARKAGLTAKRNARGEARPSLQYDLSPADEAMFDEVVLVAVNDGRFYPKQPAAAVAAAMREYIDRQISNMRETARAIEKAATAEVKLQWKG